MNKVIIDGILYVPAQVEKKVDKPTLYDKLRNEFLQSHYKRIKANGSNNSNKS